MKTKKESNWSFETFCKQEGITKSLHYEKFSGNVICQAYQFGIKKGMENEQYYSELGKIAERFFNQIHMHRAITLNIDKVKEALELISAFSVVGGNHEDWETYRNQIIQKMKEFI